MGELRLIKPVKGTISDVYGTLRRKKDKKTGKIKYYHHSGIDYAAPRGTDIVASEYGKVVRASFHYHYGHLIIIDHTPKAKNDEDHLYTLYSHLYGPYVSHGDSVKKGEKIGVVGDTGRATGPHLHFEVIAAPTKLGWNPEGNTGIKSGLHRINPESCFNHTFTKKGTIDDLTDGEVRKIKDRLDVDPHIDFKRGTWHADVYLGGKKLGRVDKHNNRITLKFTPEELEELLKSPVPPLVKGPKKVAYEIKV
ncbi:MAG: M23 family metallopeptidase [Thermodesulfobacteriota bacterium]